MCTDDVLFFHRDAEQGRERLRAFDAAQAKMKIPQNDFKGVSLQDSMTGLGCDLSNNPARVESSAARVHDLSWGTVGLLRRRIATRKAVNTLLG